jgi:hypothetical protein
VKDAALRAFLLTRACYGAVLLCALGAVIGRCAGQPASTRARTVARVLGSRHVIQAAVTAGAPNALALRVGAEVDVAHAASMFALGAVIRPVRRAPVADGLVAVIFSCSARLVLHLAGPGRFASPCQGQLKGNLQPCNERNYPCISVSGQSLSS